MRCIVFVRITTVIFFSLFVFLQGHTQPGSLLKDTSRIPSFLRSHELSVTLGYFDQRSIPDSLNGCSEQYAFDTTAFRLKKLMLFTDMNTTALLKINGRLLSFKITHNETKGKKIILVFSGHGYTIQFTSTEIKQVDMEYWVRSGILEIRKENQKKIFRVLGYYGC
ncbi:MAG: hypothetical protein V4450_07835 [Bacteroidota bacterium]